MDSIAVQALPDPQYLFQTCRGFGAAARSLFQAVFLFAELPPRSTGIHFEVWSQWFYFSPSEIFLYS